MRLNVKYLVLLTQLLANINDVKGYLPNISDLATTSALNAVKNEIPSVSNLLKKTDYNTKLSEIVKKITDHNHDKYITTPKLLLTAEIFDLRLKQGNLPSKSDIATFVSKTNFDNKLKDITSDKNELNELSKNVKAISTKGFTKDLINKFNILNWKK